MNLTLRSRDQDALRRGRRRFVAAVERLEGRRLLSTIYVDAGNTTGVVNGTPANPYLTIQAAINKSAASGDTISIAAGKYAEALTVNHSVSLVGPNAGIDPNTGAPARKPEAVIVPPANKPANGRMVLVTASNVTIDGLTIDGNNPSLPTGTLLNGISSNAATGVGNVDGAGNLTAISGLTVRDDVIRNLTAFGVIGDVNSFSGGPLYVSSGNTIAHNKIDNVPLVSPTPGRGISIEDNFYADVTDNVITRAGTGIQVIFSLSPSKSSTPSQISRNVVHDYALGIYLWNIDTATTAYNVADNTVSAEPGATATNVGIELFRILDGTSLGFTNNSVSGSRTGVEIDYDTATPAVAVTGGTLSGNAVGFEVSNASPPSGDPVRPVQAVLQGVTITNSTVAGLKVTDALSNAAVPVTLNVGAGTTVAGNPHGESLSGPYARLTESVAPVVTFTATPPAQSTDGTATFGYTAADNVSAPTDLVVRSQLDGGPPTAVAASPFTLTGLAGGVHTLVLSATDQAGNVGSASYQWTVASAGSTPAPSTPVLEPSTDSGADDGDGITNVTTPTFLGTAVAGSLVTLYAGTSVLGTTPATAAGTWAFTVAGPLNDGAYPVTATDTLAGAASAPSGALAIVIDTRPPLAQTAVSSAPNSAGWYNQTVVASYTASDPLAGLDSPAAGSFAFNRSGAGQTYTFTITDLAGNVATATVGPVNVDLTAPTVTALASPRYLYQTGGLVAVTVTGKLSDLYSPIASATFGVSDSYGVLAPRGAITVKADGTYSFVVMLDASKRGNKARNYKISVTAQNAAGLFKTTSTTLPVI